VTAPSTDAPAREPGAPERNDGSSTKTGAIFADGAGGGFRKYRAFVYGKAPWHRALYAEIVTVLFGSLGGAAGLWLRSKLYRPLFARIGSGVFFGRNVTLRHAHKIRIGDRVIVDDNVVLDAKGDENEGLTLGDGVFVGRNSIFNCKEGDIVVEAGVNFSSNCQLVSAHRLEVGADTVVGSFSYFLSGGEYDYTSPVPFAQQSGKHARRLTRIGTNCWIGAHVTVIDGASVGEHCVVGAGAVVTRSLPPNSIAVGIPARVARTL
jgi:acetyltransferase-like isoleucine patch superfamily enzyme